MSDTPFYNYQTVLEAAAQRIDDVVRLLLPGAKKQSDSWRCGDATGKPGSSFSISTRSNNAGCFTDHQDPSVRGNAIGLWAMVRNCSYDEAGRALAGFLSVNPEARLYLPKKRPAPKIVQAEEGTTFSCGGQTVRVKPLNKRSVDYAQSRGLDAVTLKRARCASTDTHIIFPHFDEDDRLVLIKCWSCDGRKNMFSNDDPIPVLFAKNLVDPVRSGSALIICEGQWDALSWIQLGYPAVSIPSGAGNDEWINEDWNFLNRFSEIYLDFDDDATGREAESRVKVRIGIERCRSIRYRYKDANAALQAGEPEVLHAAFKSAREAPIERIVRAADMKGKVRERMNKTHLQGGTPFFLAKLPFEFRPHEITLWYGLTSHGKSSVVSNQVCYSASLGKMSMVASFEQATPMTMAAMLTQYTADPDIGQTSQFDAAFDDLSSKVLFFDSMARTNPAELIATMTLAHKQLGIEEFVIDNIMTLEVDRQDNTAQASVADLFRVFVARYPVHVHEVAHPRKPSDGVTKPPSIQDIRGASEWGDMANNIICVWRDVDKAQKMSEMHNENVDPLLIASFDAEVPDGKIFIRKQRENGELPMISYRFDKRCKRAWKDPEDAMPYYFPQSEEETKPETEEE